MKHFDGIQKLSEYYGVHLKHPLIDIRKYEDVKSDRIIKNEPIRYDFYTISFVRNFNGFIKVGNTKFEGDNGVLYFLEPNQLYTCNSNAPWEGYLTSIHPNIFKEYFLHKEISTYDIFSYEANESLLLTEQEKEIVDNLLGMAWNEFHHNDDSFSIPIILSYISTLLNLAERFYARQFESRKSLHNQLSKEFYRLLKNYYVHSMNKDVQQPTVSYFAEKLNVTPNYLSDTIRHHSGKSALQVIQDYVIEEAKRELANTAQTVRG